MSYPARDVAQQLTLLEFETLYRAIDARCASWISIDIPGAVQPCSPPFCVCCWLSLVSEFISREINPSSSPCACECWPNLRRFVYVLHLCARVFFRSAPHSRIVPTFYLRPTPFRACLAVCGSAVMLSMRA